MAIWAAVCLALSACSSRSPGALQSSAAPATTPTALPTVGHVVRQIVVSKQPDGMAFGFGTVWVGHFGSTMVERIDPGRAEIVASIRAGSGPIAIDFDEEAGAAWTANYTDNTASRIDPSTNRATATVAVGRAPAGSPWRVVWYGCPAGMMAPCR